MYWFNDIVFVILSGLSGLYMASKQPQVTSEVK